MGGGGRGSACWLSVGKSQLIFLLLVGNFFPRFVGSQ